MNFTQTLHAYARVSRTVYLQVRDVPDWDRLAPCLSASLPQPLHIFRLESEVLRPEDGARILDPLYSGDTVLLMASGPLSLPGLLCDAWLEYSEAPACTYASIALYLTLEPNLSPN